MDQAQSHDASVSVEEYKSLPRHSIHLVLDNLRSAYNVGSIFRTADAARIEKIHLCGYTAHPPNPKLEKTALGTLPFVDWKHHIRTEEAVSQLKSDGITVVALEVAENSCSLYDFKFPQSVALVLGNEALGVSPGVLKQVDAVVEIPLFGMKNSVNVASACGIALFEIIRQWGGKLEPIPIYRREYD